MQLRAVADGDFPFQHAIGADLDIAAERNIFSNDGGGVNGHRYSTIMAQTRASATSVSSTVASQRNFHTLRRLCSLTTRMRTQSPGPTGLRKRASSMDMKYTSLPSAD